MDLKNKYLTTRGDIYFYVRKIPLKLIDVLGKKANRITLKTKDLSVAKRRRDLVANADNEYWQQLLLGDDANGAEAQYERLLLRAASINIKYVEAQNMAENFDIEELKNRIKMLESALTKKDKIAQAAIIGALKRPEHSVKKMFDLYFDKIMFQNVSDKSPNQLKRWQLTHQRILSNFIEAIGNINVNDIDRSIALEYRDYFEKRIFGDENKVLPSSANKEIGTMAVVYKRYYNYIGVDFARNPFADLKFKAEIPKKRKPFSTAWLANILKSPELTKNLNQDAREIFFATVETGMRRIEICNILPKNIIIDSPTPHIIIEPRQRDDKDKFQVKAYSSQRIIPLFGVSLEAFKRLKHNPNNRYIGNENTYSAVANKYFRENDLFEHPDQVINSLRHSFKDRMIEAKIDAQLRNIFMGHAQDTPDYGDGGDLKFRHKTLIQIEFDFDIEILN